MYAFTLRSALVLMETMITKNKYTQHYTKVKFEENKEVLVALQTERSPTRREPCLLYHQTFVRRAPDSPKHILPYKRGTYY